MSFEPAASTARSPAPQQRFTAGACWRFVNPESGARWDWTSWTGGYGLTHADPRPHFLDSRINSLPSNLCCPTCPCQHCSESRVFGGSTPQVQVLETWPVVLCGQHGLPHPAAQVRNTRSGSHASSEPASEPWTNQRPEAYHLTGVAIFFWGQLRRQPPWPPLGPLGPRALSGIALGIAPVRWPHSNGFRVASEKE
jgi:hypothetical protein